MYNYILAIHNSLNQSTRLQTFAQTQNRVATAIADGLPENVVLTFKIQVSNGISEEEFSPTQLCKSLCHCEQLYMLVAVLMHDLENNIVSFNHCSMHNIISHPNNYKLLMSISTTITNLFTHTHLLNSLSQTDTTDVQNVQLSLYNTTTMITVLCEFITGSDAQGCVVILVTEYENVTMNLTRSNGCSLKTLPGEGLKYKGVFGFDIEADSSIGTVPVAGKITMMDEHAPNCSPGALKPISFSELHYNALFTRSRRGFRIIPYC